MSKFQLWCVVDQDMDNFMSVLFWTKKMDKLLLPDVGELDVDRETPQISMNTERQ